MNDLWENGFKEKLGKNKLTGSMEGLKIFFECAPDGYFLHDLTGKFIDGNKNAEVLSGYKREELVGKNLFNLLIPEQKRKAALVIDKNLKEHHGVPEEFSFTRKDGSCVKLEIRPFPVKINDETLILAFARDITECKLAETLLKESEERYRTLFESSRDAIFVRSLEGKKMLANQAAVKMFGFVDSKYFLSLNVVDISPEYQPDGTPSSVKAEQMVNIAVKKGSHLFEWKHKRKDGTEFFASVLLTKIALDNKIILQATVRDITENKLAETLLKESEERYRTLFESIREPIILLNQKYKIVQGNQAAIKLFGCVDNEELASLNILDLCPEYQADGVLTAVKAKQLVNIINEKGSLAFEWKYKRKDGKEFTAEAFVSKLKLETGNNIILQVTIRDITENKLAEGALKQFKTIADNQNIGYAIAETLGTITYCNKAFAEMHGYNDDDLIGKNLAIFCPEERRWGKDLTTRFKEWLEEKEQTYNEEVRHVRNDGSIFPILRNVTVIKNEKAAPLFLAVSVIDISKRKKTEEELQEKKKELEERSKTLEETNIALGVLLKRIEEDKKMLEEGVWFNINRMVGPYLDKLKNSLVNDEQKLFLSIIKKNLNDINSKFSQTLTAKYRTLTSSELEVANLIRQGRNTKEIAMLLSVSCRTVEVHRVNIRKKFNLKHTDSLRINLLS